MFPDWGYFLFIDIENKIFPILLNDRHYVIAKRKSPKKKKRIDILNKKISQTGNTVINITTTAHFMNR